MCKNVYNSMLINRKHSNSLWIAEMVLKSNIFKEKLYSYKNKWLTTLKLNLTNMSEKLEQNITYCTIMLHKFQRHEKFKPG